MPTQLALPRCDHRPTSPTLPPPTHLPPGWALPPDSGTYRHIKLPLHLSFGPPSPSAGLTTAEARCFPASMRGSVPRARGGDRLQPAHEPPFMRPSEAATLQDLPFPPPNPSPKYTTEDYIVGGFFFFFFLSRNKSLAFLPFCCPILGLKLADGKRVEAVKGPGL